MISYDLLESITEKLAAYRGNGQGNILFDSRDRQNYSDFEWPKTVALLKSADPTGLAVAMLISAKIDTTIAHSQVRLHRVLEEPGFFDAIKEIHRIRAELDQVLEGPLNVFMERVEFLISKVSPDFGKPTKREIAVSLRDAIYCMTQGMKMSWVQCDTDQANQPIGIHSRFVQADTLSQFVELLKTDLPIGVHLAKIGASATAIGFKKPGRIAYMSSMSINHHTGKMEESRTYGEHMRDGLDLDGFDLRYPKWDRIIGRGKDHEVALEPLVKHIDRDCMIWLAMMIELANQEMARTQPTSIKLTESGKMAITHDSMVRSNLPVPYVPSWTLKMPTQAEIFESLGFSEWEKRFLSEALEGVKEGDFLPIGDVSMVLRFDTKAQVPYLSDKDTGYNYFESRELSENSNTLTSISESIAGTQEDIHALIVRVYQRNMADWLMHWGNRKFNALWKNDADWFKKRLAKNAEKALNHECASLVTGSGLMGCAVVWEQSHKHTGFHALCYFDGKTKANAEGFLNPKTAKDIVAILGLKNETYLPEHLQGWARVQGWTTSSRLASDTPCSTRWDFADRKVTHVRGSHAYYQGVVHFYSFNHPLGTQKA